MTRANRLAAKERHEEEAQGRGIGARLGGGVAWRGRTLRPDGGVQAIRRLEPNRPPMALDPPTMNYSPLSRHLQSKNINRKESISLHRCEHTFDTHLSFITKLL